MESPKLWKATDKWAFDNCFACHFQSLLVSILLLKTWFCEFSFCTGDFRSEWKWIQAQSYQGKKQNRKHNTDDEVDKQQSPRKPNTTCSCELVCLCVLLRQHWQILFNSCGFQPQTLSPSWSDRNGRSWSPRMLCFPQSLLTASHPQQDHLPSQLIGMFVLHICLCS